MFSRILIANRGEIAVRIIRACREMGVTPLAVYSSADRQSLHVRLAHAAHFIGEAPARESYLAMDKIIEAARALSADAIHPGYGFLSENPQFVAACLRAGIGFIGPSAESMETLGDKIQARRAMQEAGVPVIPGSEGSLESEAEALEVASSVGYPVMVKASAGGGGKGMRRVENEEELRQALTLTRGEAAASFGDQRVFLEKWVPRPRHIEVQILGDQQGNMVYVGERECSVQRRHQKIVEESPSPRVNKRFRQVLGETGLAAAKAAGYYNAGTVEFLVDGSSDEEVPPFYFLEMNARLQVEHPVTELVYGLDLVKEQIRIAAGQPLRLRQEQLEPRGAALECRVYAEDPAIDFRPSPGEITTLVEPGGPGIRNDSGVIQGSVVPVDYDPLISKLIAWGSDRGEAIDRMKRALQEYKVAGVATTIPLFQCLLRHTEFVAGRLSTGFLEEHEILDKTEPGDAAETAAIAAAIDYYQRARRQVTARNEESIKGWKFEGRLRGLRGR